MSTRFPPPPPPEMHATGDRVVIVADEIRVGPLVISASNKGKDAGLWIGTGRDRDMVAIWSNEWGVGVGIYQKKPDGPTDVCLYVDGNGDGAIQFTDNDGKVYSLTLADVKKIAEERGK